MEEKKTKDEFYVGYINQMGSKTKRTVRLFVFMAVLAVVIVAGLFAVFQQPAENSRFDFDSTTVLEGVYLELPYPILRIQLGEDQYKDIVLLGFGKSGALPYLTTLKEEGKLSGKKLRIEGNLLYYNGKSLLQITDENDIQIIDSNPNELTLMPGEVQESFTIVMEGEIIDPKCFFGVMKPGYGKIHRSCASLCIAGGIPPVWMTTNEKGDEAYFLITDLKGNAIHKDLLPYIGQASKVEGTAHQRGSWSYLALDVKKIEKVNDRKSIYTTE
jgi:hypothetical protein